MTIRSIFHTFLLLFCIHIDVCFADTLPLSRSLKNLDSTLQKQIHEKKAIGCAVAVVDRGEIIFIKAYGSCKKGEKAFVNLQTVFQLGSISKPISATLVAILMKEGLLDLNAPLHAFYPPISSNTTVKHLLSHMTGYKRAGWNQKIEDDQSRESLLNELADSEQTEPGTEYDYHNLAYSLIEEVVALSLQKPFWKVLEVRLFHPLQMKRAWIGDLDFAQQENYAWPHQEDKHGLMQPCKRYSHAYHRVVSSAGGINASIEDMASFLQLQMGARPDILDANDLLPFHTPVSRAADAIPWFKKDLKGDLKSYYGLGWRIIDHNETRIIFHGGWLKGFTNFLAFLPDRQIGIVILHNGESPLSKKAAMQFLNSL